MKNIWIGVNNKLTASFVALGMAQSAANVASKALMGTLTLGLSVAITGLITLFDKWQTKRKEANRLAEKLSESISGKLAGEMIAYKKLQAQWNELGNNMKSKQKYIEENSNAFESLGISVEKVGDAENILVKNSDSFVESMRRRAEALATTQLAEEKFKEYLIQYEKESKKINDKSITKSTRVARIRKKSKMLKEEYENFLKLSLEYSKKAEFPLPKSSKKKNKAHNELEIFNVGSLMKLRQEISLLDSALSRMGKESKVRLREMNEEGKEVVTKETISLKDALERRKQMQKEYLEAERKIKVVKFSESLSEVEKGWKEYYNYQKEYGTEAANKQFGELRREADSFFEYLKKEKTGLDKIVANGGILNEEELMKLDLLEANLGKLKGEKWSIDLGELEEIPIISQQIEYLIELRDKLSSSDIDKGMWNFLNLKIDEKKQELSRMFRDFVKEHRSYEEQKAQIIGKYVSLRKEIEKSAHSEEEKSRLLSETENRKNNELETAKGVAFSKTEIYDKLSENLLSITKNELTEKIKLLEEYLAGEKNLTENQRKELEKAVSSAKEISGRTDSEVMLNVLLQRRLELHKALNSSEKKSVSQTKSLIDDLAKVNEEIAGQRSMELSKALGDIGKLSGAFKELGSTIGGTNEELGETIESLADIMDVTMDITTSVAKFASGDIVGGATDLLSATTKVFSLINAGKESERKAQEEVKKFHDSIFQTGLDYNKMLRDRLSEELKINDAYKSRIDLINSERAVNERNKKDIISDQEKVWERLINSDTIVDKYEGKRGGINGLFGKYKTVEVKKKIGDLIGWQGLSDDFFDRMARLNAEKPLTGDARVAYEQLLRLKDEYKSIEELNRDLERELKNTITGTTAQSLADSIREGILSGKKQFADFADDIEDFLRGGIIAGMNAKVIEPQIQKLQDQLSDFLGDGVLTSEEKKAFEEMYMKIASEARDYMELINSAGLNIGGSIPSANSLQGALKIASQESIDLLAGQTGGMRIAQLETNQILRSGVAQQMEQTSQMIAVQIDIEKNTRKTAQNTEKLYDINDNIKNMSKNFSQTQLRAAGF